MAKAITVSFNGLKIPWHCIHNIDKAKCLDCKEKK